MALTINAVTKNGVPGDEKYVEFSLTGDANSYATGGIAVTAAKLGLNAITRMDSMGSNGTHWGLYDSTNGKVLYRLQTTGAEVANAGSTATTIKMRAYGN